MFRIARNVVDLNNHESYLLSHKIDEPEPVDTGDAVPGGEEEAPDPVIPAPEPPPPPIPMPDIRAVQRQADAMIRSAREDARALRDKVLAECEGLRAAAREEGRRSGEDAALAEGKRRTDEEIAAWVEKERAACAGILGELDALREGMFGAMEEHVLQLSLAVAEKVVGAALDRDGALFPAVVRDAIGQIQSVGRIVVRISCEDYQRYFSGGSFAMELHDESVRIAVAEDPSMARGGCIVETPDEMIDASIRTQLNIIRAAFTAGSPERTGGGDA